MAKAKDIESESNWELDSAEVRPAVQNRRVVVSVAVTSTDFEQIASAARSAQMKTSEFMREAALDKAMETHKRSQRSRTVTFSFTSSARLDEVESPGGVKVTGIIGTVASSPALMPILAP